MEQETQNYIQLQVTVKEFGGQGIQGSCSLHSFHTSFLLSQLSNGLKSEWPGGRDICILPSPLQCSSKFTSCLMGLSVMHIKVCVVRGQERSKESYFPTWWVLTLALHVRTSRLHSLRFRSSSGNQTECTGHCQSLSSTCSWLSTCNSLLTGAELLSFKIAETSVAPLFP